MGSGLRILAGLAGLLVGAELLVRGATALAARLGIRPIVIGPTVVSLGTSLPELAIGIDAARQHSPGLAVGNIIGTNLVNILFILGLSALLRPITFARPSRQVPAAGPAGQASKPVAAPAGGRGRPLPHLLGLVTGIAIIIVGAELLVDGSIEVARSLAVSEAIIGLTVVAIGTSAPELVTALVSTVRGDRDVAIGNLLGSSVYNIALILGITILVAPSGLQVPRRSSPPTCSCSRLPR